MDPYNIIVQTINYGKNIRLFPTITIRLANNNYQATFVILMNVINNNSIEISIHNNNDEPLNYFSTDPGISDEDVQKMLKTMLQSYYIEDVNVRGGGDCEFELFSCRGHHCPNYQEVMERLATKMIQRNVKARHLLKTESAKKIQNALRGSREFNKWKWSPERLKEQGVFEEWVNENSFGKKRKN
jgi:hypothetical protein